MVAVVILLVGILERRSEYREHFGELGTSIIWLSNEPREGQPVSALEYATFRAIAERLDNVAKVFARSVVRTNRSQAVTLLRNDTAADATVNGVDEAYITFMGYTMKAGRFLQAGDAYRDVAVLGDAFAEELGARVHDRVRLWGREFEVIGILTHPTPILLGIGNSGGFLARWHEMFVPFEIKRTEVERQFAAGEVSPLDQHWVDLHLVYAPSRGFAVGRRAAIVEQAEQYLQAAGFGPHDYRIGEQTTAYGYVNFVALALGAGLLLLFGILLLIYARSLRSSFSSARTLTAPMRALRWLPASSAIGGVALGLAASRLIMETPRLPAMPLLVSLAIVLPLQSLMAKRIRRKVSA
jgi:hypothetical protein